MQGEEPITVRQDPPHVPSGPVVWDGRPAPVRAADTLERIERWARLGALGALTTAGFAVLASAGALVLAFVGAMFAAASL